MSRYTIVPSQTGHGFRVEVVGADGARHTILGFDAEADAKKWISADKRRERRRLHDNVLSLESADGPVVLT